MVNRNPMLLPLGAPGRLALLCLAAAAATVRASTGENDWRWIQTIDCSPNCNSWTFRDSGTGVAASNRLEGSISYATTSSNPDDYYDVYIGPRASPDSTADAYADGDVSPSSDDLWVSLGRLTSSNPSLDVSLTPLGWELPSIAIKCSNWISSCVAGIQIDVYRVRFDNDPGCPSGFELLPPTVERNSLGLSWAWPSDFNGIDVTNSDHLVCGDYIKGRRAGTSTLSWSGVALRSLDGYNFVACDGAPLCMRSCPANTHFSMNTAIVVPGGGLSCGGWSSVDLNCQGFTNVNSVNFDCTLECPGGRFCDITDPSLGPGGPAPASPSPAAPSPSRRPASSASNSPQPAAPSPSNSPAGNACPRNAEDPGRNIGEIEVVNPGNQAECNGWEFDDFGCSPKTSFRTVKVNGLCRFECISGWFACVPTSQNAAGPRIPASPSPTPTSTYGALPTPSNTPAPASPSNTPPAPSPSNTPADTCPGEAEEPTTRTDNVIVVNPSDGAECNGWEFDDLGCSPKTSFRTVKANGQCQFQCISGWFACVPTSQTAAGPRYTAPTGTAAVDQAGAASSSSTTKSSSEGGGAGAAAGGAVAAVVVVAALVAGVWYWRRSSAAKRSSADATPTKDDPTASPDEPKTSGVAVSTTNPVNSATAPQAAVPSDPSSGPPGSQGARPPVPGATQPAPGMSQPPPYHMAAFQGSNPLRR